MKIYFPEGKKAKTLVELFQLGYALYGKFVETFQDEECTIRQCHIARRSLDDLILIANTYFDDVSDRDVLIAINEAYKENSKGMLIFYCGDINKPVFVLIDKDDLRHEDSYVNIGSIWYHDYNVTYKKESNYCIQEIVDIINECLVEELVEA